MAEFVRIVRDTDEGQLVKPIPRHVLGYWQSMGWRLRDDEEPVEQTTVTAAVDHEEPEKPPARPRRKKES